VCDLLLNSEILQNLIVTVIANVIILAGLLQTWLHMAKYAMRYDRCTKLHYKMGGYGITVSTVGHILRHSLETCFTSLHVLMI